MGFIDGLQTGGPAAGCFLCAARDASDDRQAAVLVRRPQAFAVLNRFPYNNGHTLVVPNAHKGDLASLSDEETLALMGLAKEVMALLGQVMRPDGFNLGFNFGRAAGAGLPEHLHLHVVPRWNGDTNFMPVLGETKVIPQSLQDLYDRVRRALEGPPAGG
jgi:ATP adenylyltransferase